MIDSRWDETDSPRRLTSVQIGAFEICPGDRVRLRPQGRADILDVALEGMVAIIESIEQDFEGRTYLAVVLEDDPGRDLGLQRQIGHRFFFLSGDVEPLAPTGEHGPAPGGAAT